MVCRIEAYEPAAAGTEWVVAALDVQLVGLRGAVDGSRHGVGDRSASADRIQRAELCWTSLAVPFPRSPPKGIQP